MKAIKRIILYAVILIFLLAPISGGTSQMETASSDVVQKPIPADQWTPQAKLWLARSCVGETRFGVGAADEAMEECMAIAWVYSKRLKIIRAQGVRKDLLWVIKRYSAAVKKRSTHTRPWILTLDYGLKRPSNWPSSLRWGVYRDLWSDKLATLDEWASGKRPDPVPEANHYGGSMDVKRAEYIYRWKRVPTPSYFKNRFYTSLVKVKRGPRPDHLFPHPVNI